MAVVTSPYGPRSLFGRNFHHGVDYRAPIGSPVYTNTPMTVTYAGYQNGYGNVVYAKDAQGNTHRFGHLDSIPPNVKPGATIPAGDQIATTGNTGESTGAHLHYEVRKPDGSSVDPLSTNPATGKSYDSSATFEKGGASLKGTNPSKDPGYKPNGRPVAGSGTPPVTVTPNIPGAAPSAPGRSAPGARLKSNKPVNTIITINPVLRLGDE
jgi:murein DD-endopeptidase MepM/ murein hydrolase activator NlpD